MRCVDGDRRERPRERRSEGPDCVCPGAFGGLAGRSRQHSAIASARTPRLTSPCARIRTKPRRCAHRAATSPAPATLHQQSEHLRLSASVLVESGIDVAEIASLAVLVQPERVPVDSRHYHNQAHGQPSTFAIALTKTLIQAVCGIMLALRNISSLNPGGWPPSFHPSPSTSRRRTRAFCASLSWRACAPSYSSCLSTILTRSPLSHPRKARFKSSVSRRSVLARRCSRETATLAAWITCARGPGALSQRASQKPSRPAS